MKLWYAVVYIQTWVILDPIRNVFKEHKCIACIGGRWVNFKKLLRVVICSLTVWVSYLRLFVKWHGRESRCLSPHGLHLCPVPWWSKWRVSLRILYQYTKLHGVIFQKIVISLSFITFLLNIVNFNYNFACFLYGCETWSFTLREKLRLSVFENRLLGKIFKSKGNKVTGELRKLHNE